VLIVQGGTLDPSPDQVGLETVDFLSDLDNFSGSLQGSNILSDLAVVVRRPDGKDRAGSRGLDCVAKPRYLELASRSTTTFRKASRGAAGALAEACLPPV
jgi:hypothetical protein